MEQLHRTSGHLSGHRETSGRRQAWWNSFIGRRVICRAIERRLADVRPGGTASSDVGSSVGPSRDVWPTSGLVEQLHRTSGHLSGHRETSGRRQAWWNSFIGRRVICRAIERRLADVRPGGTASSDVGSSVGPSRDVWPTSGLVEQLHRTSGHLSGHRETSGRRHPATFRKLNIAGSSDGRTDSSIGLHDVNYSPWANTYIVFHSLEILLRSLAIIFRGNEILFSSFLSFASGHSGHYSLAPDGVFRAFRDQNLEQCLS